MSDKYEMLITCALSSDSPTKKEDESGDKPLKDHISPDLLPGRSPLHGVFTVLLYFYQCYCIIKRQDPNLPQPILSSPKNTGALTTHTSIIMIQVLADFFKSIFTDLPAEQYQDAYVKILESLFLPDIPCSCGHKGCFVSFGSYIRHVKFKSVKVTLTVKRIRCKECGRTHGILPSVLVPYSQIPLRDQQNIISVSLSKTNDYSSVMESNNLIDESNVRHIRRQFRQYWLDRLMFLSMSVLDELLTSKCFSRYHMQFMQVHYTPNVLFQIST